MSIILYIIDFHIHLIKRLSWNHKISNQQYTHSSKNYIPIKLRLNFKESNFEKIFKLCRIRFFDRSPATFIFSLESNCYIATFYHRNSWNYNWRKLLLTIASMSWLCLERCFSGYSFFFNLMNRKLETFRKVLFQSADPDWKRPGSLTIHRASRIHLADCSLVNFLPANGSTL